MSNNEYGGIGSFCIGYEEFCYISDLWYTSTGSSYVVWVHNRYRIYYEYFILLTLIWGGGWEGVMSSQSFEYIFYTTFSEHHHLLSFYSESFCSIAYLIGSFFSWDVYDFIFYEVSELKGEGRFSNSWFSTKEYDTSFNYSPSKNIIEFTRSTNNFLVFVFYISDFLEFFCYSATFLVSCFLFLEFFETIPVFTELALSLPFYTFISATAT